MIVRISGEGQYELGETAARKLADLDTELTAAVDNDEERNFHNLLRLTVSLVRGEGTVIRHDTVVPSAMIIPPADTTLSDAHRFFTDEGFLQPIHA